MIIKVEIPEVDDVKRQLGVDQNGQSLLWLTNNVLKHMLKYMPMKTGMFATKQTRIVDNHTIRTSAPQAYYLYFGKRMVEKGTGQGAFFIPGVGWRHHRGSQLVPTEKNLVYTKTFHPLAGPYWDRRMIAAEGKQIAKEFEDYIKARK